MGEGKSEFETKFVCKTIKLVKVRYYVFADGSGLYKMDK